ncbi:cation efflux protein [Venturia nashicola]|uniref:Cation efflux protein n=1 Tax=Venturia nashicola TaxID=86259 RepID=A0A4Z1PBM5_9PEZI|nr:cation efflux protein [Venturia nashicola]TLD38692.1 cation efflux protein [Venturia nashicola]
MNPIKRLSRETRLSIAIAIAGCFFIVEISIGIYTRSLALIADAFHVAFDVLSFAIALGAAMLEKKKNTDQSLSFGWQRATLLGSFFNGVFQIALGFSISLLSIERFIELEHVNNPKFVFYVACAGLASNLISGLFLGVHEHSHGEADAVQLDLELLKPHQDLGHRHKIESEEQSWWTRKMKIMSHGHDHGHEDAHGNSAGNEAENGHSHHDLGMQAVLIHVLGDAFNNFGVAGAALIMWLLPQNNNNRFYADPAMSLVIGIVLVTMAVGLVKRSGRILLGSLPIGVSVGDVKHDLENVDGVISVHELHIWRLTEAKSYASAHIVMADPSIENYEKIANTMLECLHAYGVHSATIQPEFASPTKRLAGHPGSQLTTPPPGLSVREASGCRVNCGTVCEERSCCG